MYEIFYLKRVFSIFQETVWSLLKLKLVEKKANGISKKYDKFLRL